ncbi:uncharacterized protein LOC124124533 [Haliotis rufescens]|uniref:uncharacterized protein LOC124124533 n=1 Tax=Haliotis rufescens TaxID=6454 RepID=UPI00201F3AF8|nr:uncharacterized protein LOC124124533 [Haliotis rufescens]XP_046343677.2 uncharacterized protein LOC124124533 [Haliotis rufescens]
MSFIGRGGCRHCGCREYVKPPEGEKCYHCNHEMDLHVVKYQPQPTVGTPTSKTGESSVQNTMDAATVDVSLMHTGEAFEQGAPDVCFEETWEVRAPSDLAHGDFVKPHDRGAVITKRVSPMTGKDGDIGSSEDMAMFTDINRDKRGVVRGRCRDCPEECSQYSQPVLRHNCTYCGCPAAHHERVEPRPELIIKIEPGKEGAGSPGRSDDRPPRRPSRRPDGWSKAQVQPSTSRRNESPTDSRHHQYTSRTVIQKRCKTLFVDAGVTYSHLQEKLTKTQRGVFTIKWEGKIIYVGEPKKTPLLTNLRGIFTGGSQQDISKYLKSLSNDLKEKHVRIAWLTHVDDDPHCKTCREGKRKLSYRHCVSNLQSKDPRKVLLDLKRNFSLH